MTLIFFRMRWFILSK